MRTQSPQQYVDRMTESARSQFMQHQIRREEHGRWLLQQRHKDGGWDWNMAAEIVALWDDKSLFVGGDIQNLVFSYGPKDIDERLRWIGDSGDIMHYVHEKASIGTGSSIADGWVPEVAGYILDREIDERRKQMLDDIVVENPETEERIESDEVLQALRYARDGLVYDGEHAVMDHLFRSGVFDGGDILNLSPVPAPGVIFAWAAVRRLCEIRHGDEAMKRLGRSEREPAKRPDGLPYGHAQPRLDGDGRRRYPQRPNGCGDPTCDGRGCQPCNPYAD